MGHLDKRLEDRIRSMSKELCEAEDEDFQGIAAELRTAITEHITRLRVRLAQYPKADDRRSNGKS